MSNELNIGMSLAFVKNGAMVIKDANFSVDVNGSGAIHGIQEVGITYEELEYNALEIGDCGWLFMKNLDSSNFVEIGRTTSVFDSKLKAGESCLFRVTSTDVVYVLADTAPCNVEYILFEL